MRKLLPALIFLAIGCATGKDFVEVEDNVVRLENIEIHTRYGGDKAYLYWAEVKGKTDYVQVIPLEDTGRYKVGMNVRALIKK